VRVTRDHGCSDNSSMQRPTAPADHHQRPDCDARGSGTTNEGGWEMRSPFWWPLLPSSSRLRRVFESARESAHARVRRVRPAIHFPKGFGGGDRHQGHQEKSALVEACFFSRRLWVGVSAGAADFRQPISSSLVGGRESAGGTGTWNEGRAVRSMWDETGCIVHRRQARPSKRQANG
jgi:hypothetical protein